MKRYLPWLVGFLVLVIRMTCRVRVRNDRRPSLRRAGIPYVYAGLHAHNFAALQSAEPGTWAMVSRSRDGEILVPSLRLSGVTPIRGSGGESRKGGVRALREMIQRLDASHPAFLAVDGPNGPRGHVHEGVALLAKKTGAVVVPLVVIPSRRWILKKSWDRLQLPQPFSMIDFYFGDPLQPGPEEALDQFADRIAQELRRMEELHDPQEAALHVPQPAASSEPERVAA
jgi:lysophospholipid acyltransferase (LPLAT)-like uncharacterized protein